jgi:hypothetical protein
MTADGIAASIRKTMAALDAKYMRLKGAHRAAETELGQIQEALDEVTRQHVEAIQRNDFIKATELRQVAEQMDAARVHAADALAGIEKDARGIRAEYRKLGDKLRPPESIPFKCSGCGASLVATRPRKLPKGRRSAVYDCGECDVVNSVSWGAVGEDIKVQAA